CLEERTRNEYFRKVPLPGGTYEERVPLPGGTYEERVLPKGSFSEKNHGLLKHGPNPHIKSRVVFPCIL
ncbi:hypothetical protein F5144DRAFT_488667, partial [Chaetomium tenue]